jgi:HAD superfamily hydrolase (TIGR01509 family)
VNLRKPDPKIYLLTTRRLGLNPKACIFIDNEKQYLKPAKKLGMKVVLAKSPKQVINDISRLIEQFN